MFAGQLMDVEMLDDWEVPCSLCSRLETKVKGG